MSTYENYSRAAETYDKIRFPAGADTHAAFIISSQLSGGRCERLSDIKILDAGCGTGNYSARFATKHGLTNLTLVDANEMMLACAKKKLQAETGIEYKLAVLPELPSPPQSFNAVMFNYVLHHLEDAASNTDYAKTKEALTNAGQCLKPGGTVAVTTCSHHQLYEGFWYINTELIPKVYFKNFESKFMPVDAITAHLKHLGFTDIQVLSVISENIVSDEILTDYDCLLNADVRNSVSFFSVMSSDEIREMENKIKAMKSRGEYAEFVSKRIEYSQICGNTTLIIGRKGSE